ncbi:hypothetical protein GH714_036464 [Hevea brasiliensis]|uniref:Transmembrane protein n=1 Tax=Hevea brasiliensis TaxID=3981 RepID=A0A6A6L966_HEVBR|nr:hypothetical protein GH714_036421 [Hevea brasiliensis]KAF2296169.1 hypothetical protein GH714_036464 [Hevea brasiliensis]
MAVHKVLSAFALLLMIVVISHDQYPAGGGEAAEISLKRVNSKKFFATLGLDCKCCDGAEGFLITISHI